MPSLQETFNRVARHLLNQGCKSLDENGECMYRGLNGTMCTIGVLVDDNAYKPEWEGSCLANLPYVRGEAYEELKSLVNYLTDSGHDINLCDALQGVHDNFQLNRWEEELCNVADDFNLDSSVVDNFAANNL